MTAHSSNEPERALEEALRRNARLAAQLEFLQHNIAALEARLARVEDSRIFRFLRATGRIYARWRGDRGQGARDYETWLCRQEALTPDEASQRAEAGRWAGRPLFGLAIDARGIPLPAVAGTVESVRAQTYSYWRLAVMVEPSRMAEAVPWTDDPRVSLRAPLGSFCDLEGDYLGEIGARDSLARSALFFTAKSLQDSQASAVYTDEDQPLTKGGRAPLLKPDFSPELLRNCMYWGGLTVFARRALKDEGSGVGVHAAALEIAAAGGAVIHIPRVLYHRHEPFAMKQRELRVNGGKPRVTIIICSRTRDLLRKCLDALNASTDYAERDVIVVQHLWGGAADRELAAVIDSSGAVRIPYGGAYNFSDMNNRAAAAARGDVLLFLNDDVIPRDPRWLDLLASQVSREEVGVAGARLLYPDGSIQHAGVVMGMGDGVGHCGRGQSGSPMWPWLECAREVMAVTGACMATRRELFESLGGFDPAFPVNYNDVDYCLRVIRTGRRVVCEGNAVLEHREAQTRSAGTHLAERLLWFERWREVVEREDPYYSPALDRSAEAIRLRM